MKKKTYLIALMAMALTLGSCSDNENGIGGETSKYITVSIYNKVKSGEEWVKSCLYLFTPRNPSVYGHFRASGEE